MRIPAFRRKWLFNLRQQDFAGALSNYLGMKPEFPDCVTMLNVKTAYWQGFGEKMVDFSSLHII
jgi:hypothetical protein